MERNLMSLNELDFNLTDKILQKLPAKSLVRFTLACKTWYYLIKSPKFIATHLNVSRANAKGHQILILGKHLCYVLENWTIDQYIKFDFAIDYRSYWATPMGSCNGLILIPMKHSDRREYFLWNPFIKKLNKLECIVHNPYYEKHEFVNHEILGLGFLESSNSHVVVRILYVINDEIIGITHAPTEVYVYSLCTDSWHRVDSSPSIIGSSRGVFVNGVIHWLATSQFTQVSSTLENDRFESILLFNVEDECFNEMALPQHLHYRVDKTFAFNAFKGSLATIIFEATPNFSMYVLWVMTDYGVIESWTKKFTIKSQEPHVLGWPLGLLRCGILAYCEKKYEKLSIVFYDVDSGETQNVKWLADSAEVMDFVDSLVLFQG